MNIYSINGNFISEEEAKISARDLSVLRGYGIFDFMRTYNSIPFHLKDHIRRLKNSAKLLQMNLHTSNQELEETILATLLENDHQESNIRIVVTGGVSSDNITPDKELQTIVMVTPLHELPRLWYTQGAKIITTNINRFLPGAKSINYIPGILSLKEAKNQGAIEAVYCDDRGFLLEGTTSNFFGFIGEKIITAPTDRILEGITRKVVLQLAGQIGKIEFRSLHKEEIPLLDEAIITASNKEIVPITKINSITIGSGEPGPQSRKLMELFDKYSQEFKN